MDHLAVLDVPIVVAGDVNVQLQRTDDLHSRQFIEILASHGLESHVHAATHDQGGWLDIVATRSDLPAPRVDIVDPGFSDHRLLQWTSQLLRPAPVYRQVTCRPWRSVVSEFTNMLQDSELLAELDADSSDTLTDRFNNIVASIANTLAPARTVTIRPRRSDPWYDSECRLARRSCRQLDRRARRSVAGSDIQLQW